MNLAAHVLGNGKRPPGQVVLEILSGRDAGRWTRGEVLRAVGGIAAGLRRAGLHPGDRLLLRLGNRVDFPLAFLGAIWAGLVPVPTSAQLTEAEISRIAEDLRPAATVAGDGIPLPRDPGRVIGTDDLRLWWRQEAPAPEMAPAGRAAYAVYTSGTSGSARGVLHAHRAVWARRMMWQGWYGLRPGDRILHAGAFNWTFTLGTGLLDPWAAGLTALIAGEDAEIGDLPKLVAQSETTIFAAAPGVYRKILKSGNWPETPALRHGLSAGEKMPADTHDAWHAATGLRVHEALGMSEISTFVSSSPARPASPDLAGWVQPGRRVAVLDAETGRPVPLGAPGILAVSARDPGLMLGYLGQVEETRARFRGEWFLTGDMACMETGGGIRFLGRSDDMMNAGGFRVSPLEVEAAALSHPGVTEAAATALPVRPGVEVIGLFVTGPAPIDIEALSRHCRQRLARYKQPRILRQVSTLPRGANGKLLRQALREAATAEPLPEPSGAPTPDTIPDRKET